jgi:FAD/FMN-containing dehydrogenase
MPRFNRHQLACWGNHPVQPAASARPETWRALDQTLQHPEPYDRPDAETPDAEPGDADAGSRASLIARGLGRCYGDAALNAGNTVVHMQRLDRVLAFDADTGIVEAEAGLALRRLIDLTLPHGWFPAVTPGTAFVTLGGMIAADVHGKNHHTDGSIIEFVDAFELLTPAGEALWCSRHDNAELFFATAGGMGLTGVIRRVRMRLRRVESGFIRVRRERAAHVNDAFDRFEQSFNEATYSVAWIDCLSRGPRLGRSVLMAGEHARADALPARARAAPLQPPIKRRKRVPVTFPGFALNPLSVKAFNAAYYRLNRPGERLESVWQFFHPLDAVLEWNRIYGPRGFQQYQAVVPFESGREAIRAMLNRITASRRASFLAVLKAMGASSGGLLSFPMPGWTIALDLPHGPGLDALLDDLDAIALDHGGRRYLAKDASMSPERLGAMYPRLDEFRAVRDRVDPQRRLSSSLSRRLGIDSAEGVA